MGAPAPVFAPTFATTQSAPATYSSSHRLASATITTHGMPVLILATGEANPVNVGGWCRIHMERNGTRLGCTIQPESSAANENVPFSLHYVDDVVAGTYTYTLEMTDPNSAIEFSENSNSGPVFSVIELGTLTGATGAVGPTGPRGPAVDLNTGVGSTVVDASGMRISATSVAPVLGGGGFTANTVSSCFLADRFVVEYRVGWDGSQCTTGSGDYLIQLPTGVTFNTALDKNPVYTGVAWNPSVAAMAPYMISCEGGLVQPGSWNRVAYVVPYSAYAFRLFIDNNTVGGLQFWSSSFSPVTSGSSALILKFDLLA